MDGARTHSARTEANARLTSLAGLVLLVLLAAQGVTIVAIHRLLAAHVVIGLALLGPLAVKLGSTGWRFARYYAGDREFGEAGPPLPLLRLLAPVLVAATLVVFGTGVGLLAVHPGHGSVLLLLHKASFVVWFGVTTVHVLAYTLAAVRRVWSDAAGRGGAEVLRTRAVRAVVIGVSVVGGFVLGAAGLGWAHPWLVRGAGGR